MIDPNKTTNGNPDPGYSQPGPDRYFNEDRAVVACEGCGLGYLRSEMPDGLCVWCEEVEANAPSVDRQ